MKKLYLISVMLLLMACQNATKETQMNEETLYRPLLHFTQKRIG